MTAPPASPGTLVHRYKPVGSALALFRCRKPEVLLSGAAGTGKSRACLEKVHAMCLKNPGMKALVVRKTLVSLTSTGLATYEQFVATEAIASGEVVWYGGSSREAACYRYGNGSRILVGGMDKASRIMSSDYDVIYVQEATELDLTDWEALTTRLRNGKVSFQQIMADCNPDAPHHWLYQRSQSGTTELVYCRHEDNPVLFDAGQWTEPGLAYMAKLDSLTGMRKERWRYGRWVAAEGLVYSEFDPAINFHDPIRLPPKSWPRYWSVDFGFNNPFVCQFWAQDPDGRLYLYREWYMTKGLVEDHARELLKILKRGDGHQPDVEPVAVICDHDAEDRATLERHLGMGTVAAIKTVSDGIQAVQARLKVQKDGKPQLYLCRDALVRPDQSLVDALKPVCANDEIVGYIWDKRPVPGSDQVREAPLKQDDHSMDAMRYLVAYHDLRTSVRYRSFDSARSAPRRDENGDLVRRRRRSGDAGWRPVA